MAITYNIYKGSEKIASDVAEKTYTVDGLDPATEYTFGVSRVENGTESDKATFKVTTAAQKVTGITPS
ncbi:fibronectin type III domain-containing protein, partial [Flavonifractor plautii]|uniref:fibronectin type III domain-containing protein n=1 Tax=Flavonifractor plautii TaxID=292800 RepID=UPI003D7EA71A